VQFRRNWLKESLEKSSAKQLNGQKSRRFGRSIDEKCFRERFAISSSAKICFLPDPDGSTIHRIYIFYRSVHRLSRMVFRRDVTRPSSFTNLWRWIKNVINNSWKSSGKKRWEKRRRKKQMRLQNSTIAGHYLQVLASLTVSRGLGRFGERSVCALDSGRHSEGVPRPSSVYRRAANNNFLPRR